MSLTKVSYSMIAGDMANVIDFGAATTNTATQNKTAFEAALASGKKVFIPEGTWPIQNVNVPEKSCLQGSGIGKTVLLVTSGQDGLILGGSPPTSYIGNVQIGDFEIRNNEAYIANDPPAPGAAHTGRGIVMVGVVDSSFDNILIQYFQYGVYARSSWDLKFGLFKAYNCNIGFKVPRLYVDGNSTFNSTSFQTFVSEGCLIAGASFGYGANLSFQAAQVENQKIGMYFGDAYFIDIGTTYWEWSNSPGLGDYVYLFGQDETSDHGTPAHLNIRNTMTSTYSAGVGVKNADNVYLSGELQWSSLALSGNTNFRWDGFAPKAVFGAYLTAQVNNVTGDNTAYTVICDTELSDDGGYYNNATGVFTANQDGKYRFTAKANLTGLLAAHDTQTISIIAGGQTYSRTMQFFDGANVLSKNAMELNIQVALSSGNTVYMQVQVTGNPSTPAKVVDVEGSSATRQTLFCGEFIATF
jgi:hypothetical protein